MTSFQRIYFWFADKYAWVRANLWPDDRTLIDEGIWQGGAIDKLPDGINAILSLLAEHEDRFGTFQTKVARTLLPAAFCWMPIVDAESATPRVEWLDAAVDTVLAWRRANWTVLIHCMQGKSRSGMVSIACQMKLHGLTADAAYIAVKAKRPITEPNPGFMRILEEYERYLAK